MIPLSQKCRLISFCLLSFPIIAKAGDADISHVAEFDPERVSTPAIAPHVPEPMVFDLVRPLGARKGELEVNVLGIAPLKRRSSGSARAGDELGLVPLSEDRSQLEWAPEIEFALWDGFAVEFEFPFEGSQLEELKWALQWTAGTAFDNRFIHGFQGISEYALQSHAKTWTGLYLAAMRFNSRWSALGMWGFSHETGAGFDDVGGERTQILQNLSVFYNVTESWHVGLETNYARSLKGDDTLLVMPQLQFDMGRHLSLQMGVGIGLSESETLPQAAMRMIVTF